MKANSKKKDRSRRFIWEGGESVNVLKDKGTKKNDRAAKKDDEV